MKNSERSAKSGSTRLLAPLSILAVATMVASPSMAQAQQRKSRLEGLLEWILPESLYPTPTPTPAPRKPQPQRSAAQGTRPTTQQRTSQPPRFVTQAARPFAAPPAPKPTPAISVAEMSDQLKAKLASSTTLTKQDRSYLVKFYEVRNYTPIWFEPNPSPGKTDPILNLSNKGSSLRSAMIELSNHGLKATNYWSAEAENAGTAPTEQWSQNELLYSRALIRSAMDLNIGRFDPRKVNSDIKLDRKTFTAWQTLTDSVNGPIFLSPWDQFAPKIPQYKKLHDALAKLRAVNAKGETFGPMVASKTTLKYGSSTPAVRDLKVRAAAMGYSIGQIDTSFDRDLEDAVKDIQKANLTSATGVLKPTDLATWSFFKPSLQERIQEVSMQMEKLRWLPNQMENRYLFINLATQKMNVVDPDLTVEAVREMKVIVGKPTAATRTPTFRNQMTYIVVNPTWTVPSSIFFRSKIGKIREILETQGQYAVDSWFYNQGFSIVYQFQGQTYYPRPSQINWYTSDAVFSQSHFTLKQAPSYDNALGVVKFLLDNNYSIWLHDTNERHLFRNDARALSSGCIRLEKPRDLAEYLLAPKGISRDRLESTFVRPGQIDAKEQWNNVSSNKLAVYTMHLTANVGDDGILRFTRDLYNQNADMARAMKAAGIQ